MTVSRPARLQGEPKIKDISTKSGATTLTYYGLEITVEDGYAFYFRVYSTDKLNPAAFKTKPAKSANKAKPATPTSKANPAASASKANPAASASKAKTAASAVKANASAWSSMTVRAGEGVGPIRLKQTCDELIRAAGKPTEIKDAGKPSCKYVYRIGTSEISVYFIRHTSKDPMRVSLIFVKDRRDSSNGPAGEVPGNFTTPEGVTLGTPVDKAVAKLGKGYTYAKLPNGTIYNIDGSGIKVDVSLGVVRGFMIEKKKIAAASGFLTN